MSFYPFHDPFFGSNQRETDFEEFKQTAIKTEQGSADNASRTTTNHSNMPKMVNMDDHFDQEDVEPLDEEDNDRAISLLRKMRQPVFAESDNEQADDEAPAFNHDHTLDHGSQDEYRSPTPADSNQPTPSDQDGSVDDSAEPVPMKVSKKRAMPQRKVTKRQERSSDTVNPGGRSLRVRTPAQKTPFAADKLAYTMTKSRGRNPSKAEIEKQLEKQEHNPPSASTKKQPKRSKIVEPESSDQSTTEDEFEPLSDDYKLMQTTVRFIVAGSTEEEGGMELPLWNFSSVHRLIAYSNERWGRVHQHNVHHLTCERPWKGKDSNLAMYEGWEDQFEVLVKSVLEAPIWRKKTTSPTLDVKMIVHLKVPP